VIPPAGRSSREGFHPDDEELLAGEEDDHEEDARIAGLGTLMADRRKLATLVGIIFVAIAAIYVLLPKVAGLHDVADKINDADWEWVAVAIAFNVLAFGAYVMLFRGVLGGRGSGAVRERLDVRASYQITMAGLAATRIFSAAGAGGIILSYWALRKAGMPRRRSASRMVAFLVLMYSVYLLSLVLFGVLLRTGVLPGKAPTGGTTVPAAIGGGAIIALLLVSLIPGNFERRLSRYTGDGRGARLAQKLATVPATLATGVRTALDYLRHPRDGALALGGAVGFWAANIGILWASFRAFGAAVPFGVLVQGFFVGMTANLIPSPAGGVGSVDAGMIGAFVLFGFSSDVVFPAVLTYRVIAFWLPIPPGVVAYFQLRRTVARWEGERGVYTSESKVTAEAPS
jgi:uncharacterized protein (TIRG00374 family)